MFPHKKLDWLISRLSDQVDANPDDPELRHELARAQLSRALYHGGGEPWANKALVQARKVLADDASHVDALVTAGSALVALGRVDAAHPYLDEALKLDAERADLHLAMGALARSEGDRHLAVRHLETACRLAPDDWETHLYLGRALAERARELRDGRRAAERAQFHLVRALQLGPTPDLTPPLLRDIGLSCLATGRYAEAAKFFTRLREHERYAPAARLNLGLVSYHLGKYKNAIQHFRQFLRDRPEDPRVHARIAMAYLQLGEHDRARHACNQALLVDPGNRLARYTLGCTLLEEGNPNEAVRVFKEALQEHPDHLEAYLELARLRRSVGDVAWMEQALLAEASSYDRLPAFAGERSPREVTRARVDVLLDQLRSTGTASLPILTRALAHVQDEGLRFRIFETACSVAGTSMADEVAEGLKDAPRRYSPELGLKAVAAAGALAEPLLTRGLSLTEEDLKRAAVERHPSATDVSTHRDNIEAERKAARAWQALLLLAIASRRSRAGRRLLETWSDTADDELSVAAHAGLAMMGDAGSMAELGRWAAHYRANDKLDHFIGTIAPARALRAPRPVADQGDVSCSACGRTAEECTHLMAGSDAVICDICVLEVSRGRGHNNAPDEARCHFCGKTHLETRGVYRHHSVDICSDCLELSLGLVEREEVDRFLAAF
ncbi:MAG: tetratricopeptide repeat protein [Alphaproteobacteria bacterium]|nr:tetratricopeptide repeat protein [Alphaproteobacteria bacterium]MCB9794368.1 tetratricopeptide repeat protein [Alphaproteobacteria bacterium]